MLGHLAAAVDARSRDEFVPPVAVDIHDFEPLDVSPAVDHVETLARPRGLVGIFRHVVVEDDFAPLGRADHFRLAVVVDVAEREVVVLLELATDQVFSPRLAGIGRLFEPVDVATAEGLPDE